MQIPRSYIENYSRALDELDERTKQALMRELETINYDADPAAVRSYVSLIMQRYCGASATVAARLAADFYDGLRARFGLDDGYTAIVDPGYEPMATDGAVRAFTKSLVDGKPDEFKRKCVERSGYETRKAANKCVEKNARRDPKKPRWARVPTGAETCRFCIMLASRGFVYHSEELASHSHDHCDCRVIPSWDGKRASVEGYDPDYYLDVYNNPENHPEVAEAINARRRELYAEKKLEGENKRGFANSLRTSRDHVLTEKEIDSLISDAISIGIDPAILRFNEGTSTAYHDHRGIITVRGDVLPDLSSTRNRDRMTARAVLAHEFYGHAQFPDSSYPPGHWADEFRASYRAAIDTPGITDEERASLMVDAYERAAEAGVRVRYNKRYQEIVYGYRRGDGQ